MKKSKGILTSISIIVALCMPMTLFSGCGSSKTTTTTSSTGSASATTNQPQAKADIKTIVKDLVTAGTLKQAQADKIVAAFEKNPNAAPGPNGPLESLVSDKTITEDQEHAIMDKMFGGAGGPGGAGGKGGAPAAADTSSIKTKYLDVAYAAKSDAQKLDVYLPNTGNGPFPVIISIHGGAFKSGDKNSGELTPMLKGLDRGYAVVAVNYRLSGEAKFPAQINDINAAIRFIKANASKYNLNPDKIATWGGSAGGSLSALTALSSGESSLEGLELGNSNQSSKVQACIDWFGPVYFSTMDAEFKALGVTPVGVTNGSSSPEAQYLGTTIGSSDGEAIVKKASPLTYIDKNDPPTLIEHGTADKNIPITQSENFAKKLASAIGDNKVVFKKLDGAGHGTSEFTTDENVKFVLDFLDKYLK